MALTRSEAIGLGVAAIGHGALFVLLAGYFLPAPNPDKLVSTPIAVSFAEDVGLESTAPEISSEEEAAKKSPVEAPVEPDSAPPEPVSEPEPAARPQPAPPKPAPAPAEKPKPAPAAKPAPPSKPAPPTKAASAAASSNPRQQPRRDVRPTGNLEGLDLGRTNNRTESTSTTPPAATAGPQVRSALQAEVMRQVKPHWTPPSGADSEKLRTTVVVQLNRDGSIAAQVRVTQTGVTDSNRTQAALHKERAIRAVKLAAPFKLPAQYYDAWKTIGPTLYEDL